MEDSRGIMVPFARVGLMRSCSEGTGVRGMSSWLEERASLAEGEEKVVVEVEGFILLLSFSLFRK